MYKSGSSTGNNKKNQTLSSSLGNRGTSHQPQQNEQSKVDWIDAEAKDMGTEGVGSALSVLLSRTCQPKPFIRRFSTFDTRTNKRSLLANDVNKRDSDAMAKIVEFVEELLRTRARSCASTVELLSQIRTLNTKVQLLTQELTVATSGLTSLEDPFVKLSSNIELTSTSRRNDRLKPVSKHERLEQTHTRLSGKEIYYQAATRTKVGGYGKMQRQVQSYGVNGHCGNKLMDAITTELPSKNNKENSKEEKSTENSVPEVLPEISAPSIRETELLQKNEKLRDALNNFQAGRRSVQDTIANLEMTKVQNSSTTSLSAASDNWDVIEVGEFQQPETTKSSTCCLRQFQMSEEWMQENNNDFVFEESNKDVIFEEINKLRVRVELIFDSKFEHSLELEGEKDVSALEAKVMELKKVIAQQDSLLQAAILYDIPTLREKNGCEGADKSCDFSLLEDVQESIRSERRALDKEREDLDSERIQILRERHEAELVRCGELFHADTSGTLNTNYFLSPHSVSHRKGRVSMCRYSTGSLVLSPLTDHEKNVRNVRSRLQQRSYYTSLLPKHLSSVSIHSSHQLVIRGLSTHHK